MGREVELTGLETTIKTVGQGKGQNVLIAGEAGIGKSRLLAEIRRRAAADDFRLLAGMCFEPDLTFPYAPLIDALRSYLAAPSAGKTTEFFGLLAPDKLRGRWWNWLNRRSQIRIS